MKLSMLLLSLFLLLVVQPTSQKQHQDFGELLLRNAAILSELRANASATLYRV
jgi:hypothetical protein